MKKTIVIAVCVGAVLFGVSLTALLLAPKEKIKLSIEDNHITWIDNSQKNKIGSNYYIYNDDFLVNKLTEQSYFITKEKLIDEAGPSKVEKMSINYTKDDISLEWDPVQDNGSDNNIWVGLYNQKDKLLSFSNKVILDYVSGVDKYILEIENEKFNLYTEDFSIDRNYLKDGITMGKLYAIDKRGNESNAVSIPLYNYNVILNQENNKINFRIDDNTQKYKYKVIVNGNENVYIKDSEELNSLFVDSEKPNDIVNVQNEVIDKNFTAVWEEVKDRGSKYNIKIEAYGLDHLNSAYSDELEFFKTSETKGYYYKINDVYNYSITDKDSFTTNTKVDFKGEYGKYYLHIAAVDNNNNIGNTKTIVFELINPLDKIEVEETLDEEKEKEELEDNNTNKDESSNSEENSSDPDNEEQPEDNKDDNSLNNFNDIIILKGNLNQSVYDKAMTLLKKINYNDFERIKNNNIKIYITSDDAESLYKNLTGITISKDITGIFEWNAKNPFIIVESSYIDSSLIHEIGHAMDYILGDKNFISKKEEFIDIYELEKDLLIENDSYLKSSSSEYFAETYNQYYINTYLLKTKAPKTFNYLNSILS